MSTLSRRTLLSGTALAVAGLAIPLSADSQIVTAEHNAQPLLQGQFMVGDNDCACDWRWPNRGDDAVWTMSSREGVSWYNDGPLNEDGRALLLDHFALEPYDNRFPLERISRMSPAALVAERRKMEPEMNLPRYEIAASIRIGGHIPAETCI